MDCAIDHQALTGKFCPGCGAKAETARITCISGHVMAPSQKYCASCGKVPAMSVSLDTFSNASEQDKSHEGINLGNGFSSLDSNPIESNSKKSFFAAIVGFAVLIIIVIAQSNSKSEPVTVTVNMTIAGESCWNLSWGYGDVPGAQIIVTVDADSTSFGSYSETGLSSGSGCMYTAYVSDVPSDGENYSVEMASGRRGTIYNTRSELESNDWTFDLTLG